MRKGSSKTTVGGPQLRRRKSRKAIAPRRYRIEYRHNPADRWSFHDDTDDLREALCVRDDVRRLNRDERYESGRLFDTRVIDTVGMVVLDARPETLRRIKDGEEIPNHVESILDSWRRS